MTFEDLDNQPFRFTEPTTARKIAGTSVVNGLNDTHDLFMKKWLPIDQRNARYRWNHGAHPLKLADSPLHLGQRKNKQNEDEFIAFFDRAMSPNDVAYLLWQIAVDKEFGEGIVGIRADWEILKPQQFKGNPEKEQLAIARANFHAGPSGINSMDSDTQRVFQAWKVSSPHMKALYNIDLNSFYALSEFLRDPFKGNSPQEKKALLEGGSVVNFGECQFSHFEPAQKHIIYQHRTEAGLTVKSMGDGSYQTNLNDRRIESFRVKEDSRSGDYRLKKNNISTRSNMIWYPTLRWNVNEGSVKFIFDELDTTACGQVYERLKNPPHVELLFDTIRFNPWIGYTTLTGLDTSTRKGYGAVEYIRGRSQRMGIAQSGMQATMYQQEAANSQLLSVVQKIFSN
jgi:hypothetical protein